jgi:FtsP/CotA-like multicopper oxidase with cupredoxin domain
MHRYHAHSSVQRADGLYGGLIIHKPAVESTSELSTYQYEREQLLLIGDWYHRRANTVLDWFEDFSHFGNEVSSSHNGCIVLCHLMTDPHPARSGFSSHKRERVFQLLHGSSGTASGLRASQCTESDT